MVDGFDNQASAFAAPALMAQWHVARAALGPVFAASAFGTLAGSLLIGPLGDLLGRKTLVVLSLVLAAALMAATGFVSTLPQLIAIRFVTGLPLGAVGNHLRVLLDAGAVLRRRAGREVLYWRTSLGDALAASTGP